MVRLNAANQLLKTRPPSVLLSHFLSQYEVVLFLWEPASVLHLGHLHSDQSRNDRIFLLFIFPKLVLSLKDVFFSSIQRRIKTKVMLKISTPKKPVKPASRFAKRSE